MITKLVRRFATAVLVFLLMPVFASLLGIAAAAPDTTTAPCEATCGDFRVGNTVDDVRTSHGVEHILARSLAAYAEISQLYAAGRHFSEIKLDASRRILREQRIEVAYARPNRLRVLLSDPSGRPTARFVADGEKVLMVWDKQMGLFGGAPENLVYLTLVQPPLAAFVDEEIAGDLYEDASGCLNASIVAPLLVSRNPGAWMHSHVTDYVYEGTENIGSSCCHRLRFHQSSPDLAVTQWIDCETGLVRKLSVVRAQTEQGTPSWSLSSAASGEMWVTVLDNISTGPLPKGLRFDATPPVGLSEAKLGDEKRPPSSGEAKSFLQRLLRAAAGSAIEKTSASVERQSPAYRWQVKRTWRFDAHIAGISTGRARMLVIATADGKLWRLDCSGLEIIPAQLDFYPDIAVPWRTADRTLLLLARSGGVRLQAIEAEGRTLWSRSLPSRLWCVLGDDESSPPRLWLGLESGLARLEADGSTAFSIRRQHNITQLLLGQHPDFGRVLVGLTIQKPELWLYNVAGRPVEKLLPSDPLLGAEPCDAATGLLLVGAISREGNELALRGLAPNAETMWTTYVAPRLERLSGDFTSIHDTGTQPPEQHFVAITPTGALREVDAQGRIVWDGQLALERLQAMLAGGAIAEAMTSGDFNGDGREELYITSDRSLIEIGRTD
ncbi:MAG: LolA family protein [Candidatus Sumerlaeaceae bacterium]|jgi:hypothetical protein